MLNLLVSFLVLQCLIAFGDIQTRRICQRMNALEFKNQFEEKEIKETPMQHREFNRMQMCFSTYEINWKRL